ncbi:TPA: hypothetical protein ACOQ31_002597 [Bacillus cereus]|uniref:DUF7660 domain-containing protein n=1 Tax=Bacillus cereus TaxID=1396 RepID=A0ABD4LJZ2_BACCE|nr:MULTISPECIES: hypothetical protein [Bacillus cereus group]MBK1610706.1 hypothetical protein [Bacillus cereus]MBL3765901.1 hypothetical protein [Bacillus cereus]MBL3771868.1 hypothetical protein [Bacillus cereus]MBL3777739.1 hypothetical protein [Bacillus cereus]MBL3789071.1 hypothetical protein [Bacillus cereus]
MYDLAYGVDSKEKLVEFLFYLQKDFKENQEDWENITLADYLESMEAWLNDCDGVFQNKGEEMPKDISWNFLAMVLLAGSFYE